MYEFYLGQIIPFMGNFAPENCCFCDGRLLIVNDYTSLFSLIGYTYGYSEDGKKFGIPDLRGRMVFGAGTGEGLSTYDLGSDGGAKDVYLDYTNLPSHNHQGNFTPSQATSSVNIPAYAGAGQDSSDPTDKFWGSPNQVSFTEVNAYNTQKNTVMNPASVEAFLTNNGATPGKVTVGNTGGSNYHNNMSPFFVLNWVMVIHGLYPNLQ